MKVAVASTGQAAMMIHSHYGCCGANASATLLDVHRGVFGVYDPTGKPNKILRA